MKDIPGIMRCRYPALTRLHNDWAWLPLILISLVGGIYLLSQNDLIAYVLSIVFLVIFPAAVLQSIKLHSSTVPSEVEIEGSLVRLKSHFAHREFALADITEVETGIFTPRVSPCFDIAKIHYIWLGKPDYFFISPHMNGSSELVEFLKGSVRNR